MPSFFSKLLSAKKKLLNDHKENKRKKTSLRPHASNAVLSRNIVENTELKTARKKSSSNVVAAKKRSETVKPSAEASKPNQQQSFPPTILAINNPNIVWTSDSSLIAAFEAKPLPMDGIKQEEEHKELKPTNIKTPELKKQQSEPKLKKSQTSSKGSKESAKSLRKRSPAKSDSPKPLAIRCESKEKKEVVLPVQKQVPKSPEMLQEVTAKLDLDEEKVPGDSSSPSQKQNSDSSTTNQDDNVPTAFEQAAAQQRPANEQKPSKIAVDEVAQTRVDGDLRPFTPENKQKSAVPQTEETCNPVEKKENEHTPKSPSNEDPKPSGSVYMPCLPSYN